MSTQASLLDLPELALEHIAVNLSLSDLTNCMLCCSTLHTLLRPRQTAMVRACSLGCRWVLRACGRTLFADISQRVAGGVAAFEGAAEFLKWTPWTEALEGIAGHGPQLIQSWIMMKARHSCSDLESVQSFCTSSFFFIWCLAESRGFGQVVGKLEKAWNWASSLSVGTYKREWDLVFSEQRTWARSDFSFLPFESFLGDCYFPGPLAQRLIVAGHVPRLASSLFRAILGMLNAEVVGVLFMAGFLEIYNDADFHLTEVTPRHYAKLKARGCGDLYEDVCWTSFKGFRASW